MLNLNRAVSECTAEWSRNVWRAAVREENTELPLQNAWGIKLGLKSHRWYFEDRPRLWFEVDDLLFLRQVEKLKLKKDLHHQAKEEKKQHG